MGHGSSAAHVRAGLRQSTNESWHVWMSCEWVMAHITEFWHMWMDDGTCQCTYEWVMSHMNGSWHIWMVRGTYEWFVAHMNELRQQCRRIYTHIYDQVPNESYGVATVSRIDKIIGLFCRISSLLQGSFAKKTYHLIDSSNQSHPIAHMHASWHIWVNHFIYK